MEILFSPTLHCLVCNQETILVDYPQGEIGIYSIWSSPIIYKVSNVSQKELKIVIFQTIVHLKKNLNQN